MRGTFRALKSRNYRLFFVGQTLSLIGTWMQSVAMSWLVYELTGSAAWLGVVTCAQQIPMFFISPMAGMFIDRVDRRLLLITTQSLQALQALLLSALVLGHWIQPWEILALSVFVGIVNAFDTPGRQAFVIEMVDDRNLLSNAIALNSTQFNIARLIGPVVAGVTIELTGEGWCFMINAISFIAVIVSLVLITVPRYQRDIEASQPWSELMEGARYVGGHRPIMSLLLLLAVVSLVSGTYQVLLPVLAGNAAYLGYLYTAVGIGALCSALLLATRTTVIGLGRWIAGAGSIFSIGLALLGFASMLRPPLTFPVEFLCCIPIGFGAMLHMGSTNIMIQTMVDDRMRGRVMAFYAMSFIGTMSVGSLVVGWLADRIPKTSDPPMILLACSGLIGLLACVGFAFYLPHLRVVIRAIYESKGIRREAT